MKTGQMMVFAVSIMDKYVKITAFCINRYYAQKPKVAFVQVAKNGYFSMINGYKNPTCFGRKKRLVVNLLWQSLTKGCVLC